jgi:serine/threonine-protein kinase RsbW
MENSSIVMTAHVALRTTQYRKEAVQAPDGTVRLELPADPASLSVVRAVVASVASRLSLAYDSVDDLRIAAAEAGGVLLSSAAVEGQLRVELMPSETDLVLRMWVDGGAPSTITDRDGLAWRVIEGLADEASVIDMAGAPAIEMRIRTVR